MVINTPIDLNGKQSNWDPEVQEIIVLLVKLLSLKGYISKLIPIWKQEKLIKHDIKKLSSVATLINQLVLPVGYDDNGNRRSCNLTSYQQKLLYDESFQGLTRK